MRCASHDTSGLPLREQVRRWQEATDHYFGPLQAQALCDGPFDAHLAAYDAGALRLLSIEAPAHSVARDRVAGDAGHDRFKLLLQVQGVSEVRRRETTFLLRPGEWSLYDPRVPYTITSREPIRQFAVQIPRERLGSLPGGLLRTSGDDAPGQAAVHHVLGSFVVSLAAQMHALPDAAAAPLAETLLALLAQALHAGRDDAHRRLPAPELMRARVRQYVHQHLADTELGVDRIARELRCSARYLHALFQHEPQTLERQIWRLRLERCRQSLAGADPSAQSISALAYRWGFSSNAHFCRVFKREYGTTPSAFLKHCAH